MTDNIDTAKLRDLDEAATPVPWAVDTWYYDRGWVAIGPHHKVETNEIDDGYYGPLRKEAKADAELITAMRNALPAILDHLDAQAEEMAALRRNRAAWEASGLALETRVRELETLLQKHAALHCDECIGSGLHLGDDDIDGPCNLCGGSGRVLPPDVTAALAGLRSVPSADALPASRGTTSGELLQLHDRAERPDAYAVADSEGGET